MHRPGASLLVSVAALPWAPSEFERLIVVHFGAGPPARPVGLRTPPR